MQQRARQLIPMFFKVCPKTGGIVGLKITARRRAWLFPLVGLAALAWYLIRVLPKPSRAAYPCQRIAAPLASSFLAWAAGACVFTFAFRQFRANLRRSRYLWAAVCLTAAAAALLWTLLGASTPAQAQQAAGAVSFYSLLEQKYAHRGFAKAAASTTATQSVAINETHAPMGSALGVFPGRVVWTRDPSATNENCRNTAGDYWWQDGNTNQTRVDSMFSATIRRLTGATSDAAAWDSLFHYFNRRHGRGNVGYQAGQTVAIKVNLCSAYGMYPPSYTKTAQIGMIDTSPQMIRALLRHLSRIAGVPESAIYIGDPMRPFFDQFYSMVQPQFPAVNYLDPWGASGRTLVVPTADPVLFVHDSAGTGETAVKLPRQFVDAAYVIDMAALKAHSGGGVTLCAKNYFGAHAFSCTGPECYGTTTSSALFHSSLPGSGFGGPAGMGHYRDLVDLLGHKDLGGKCMLNIVDGLWGAGESIWDPNKWKSAPFNSDWPSSVLMSQDPVALESVGFDLLRTEYNTANYPAGDSCFPNVVDGAEDYLHQAADPTVRPAGISYDPTHSGTQLGSLGVHEHWNNAAERAYSRNIDPVNGTGIELVSLAMSNQAPAVSLSSPANLAQFAPGVDICLAANASDPDGNIAHVNFYAGGTLLGTAFSRPYAMLWSGAAAGGYSLTAVAVDNQGAATTSAPVTVTVAAGASAFVEQGGLCVIEAEDYAAMRRRNDGVDWTTATATGGYAGAGYMRSSSTTARTWSTGAELAYRVIVSTPGAYYLAVRGTASSTSGVFIGVDSTQAGTTAQFTATATAWRWSQATVSLGTLTAGVHTVQIRRCKNTWSLDRLAIATSTSLLPANGATDAGPAESVRSLVDAAPTASITYPANNAGFYQGADITITANATDNDGSVTKVEFYAGAAKIGESAAAPFSCPWLNVQPATYAITAKAYDNAGAITTSAPITVTVIATGPLITVSDFADYQVLQRDIGGVSKSVTVSGVYANMPWNRVEARVLRHAASDVVVDWTPIDVTYGGGTFSGSLTVPQGGWYDIEVRALDAADAVLGSSRGTHKWGVGMIILCIGQSNMVGNGQPPFTVASSDLAVNYSNAGRWEHLADPYDDESPSGAVDNDNDVISGWNVGGSMIPALANSLTQTFNFPVAFVPAAKGGSALYCEWVNRTATNHFDTTTLYGYSITKAQRVGGVELIVMHQGETDEVNGRTPAQYMADFTTMIGNYRQDLYATIPIFLCQLGTCDPGVNGSTADKIQAVRAAQHDLDNGHDIFMAATAMDQSRMDQVHLGIPGLNAVGARVANAIKYYLGAATYYRGPAISSAFFTDVSRTQVMVKLAHRGGSDIAPSTGITGFEVLDNGTPVTISSAGRIGGDQIALTPASAIPAASTVTLRYLYGENPNTSGLVKDNTALALPLENTTTPLPVTAAQLPIVTIAATDPAAAEAGLDPGRFTITRDVAAGPLTVNYTVAGTATSGVDYTALPGSVTFLNGQSKATVDVIPIDDALPEVAETVILTLAANPAYCLGSPASATVTIADNEPPIPVVNVVTSDSLASESGPDDGAFTVTRDVTSGSLTVNYALSGTATNGTDYAFLNGQVVIPAGQSQAVIPVQVIDDALAEGNESVTLTLSADAAYHVGTAAAASLTIQDNDIFQFTWQSYNAVIKSGAPFAQVTDSSGTSSANIAFYLSGNDNGVDFGTAPFYVAGAHPLTWTNLAAGYWAWSYVYNGFEYTMPFCGRSAVARGSDVGESNTPRPLGVYDLEVHPPNTERLTVTAFIAPMAGVYSVSNLAARRVSNNGANAQLKLFDRSKALLATLQAGNSRAWVTSSSVYSLGSLSAGDTIYFGADRSDGDDWAYDGMEMAWTVSCQVTNQPPAVSITAPSSGASYDAGAPIAIAATATDIDGAVAKVAFYADGVKIGEDAAAPYACSWTAEGGGAHTLTAMAIDNAGASTTSSAVSITVNVNQPPAVSITSPADNASFREGADVVISADASDADGTVARVEFFQAAVKIGEDASAPYQITWSAPPSGRYLLTAVATDNDGASTTSLTKTITVNANVPPTAGDDAVTTNEDNAVTVTVLTNDNDADGDALTVTSVTTPAHGTAVINAGTTVTYTPAAHFSGADSFGYTISDGHGGSASATVSITVVAVNQPPTVTLTAPANGLSFPLGSSITIKATASDPDGSVSKVSFYGDGVKLYDDATSPYSYAWKPATLGAHTVYAIATDNSGATATSATVNITANVNKLPTVKLLRPRAGATLTAGDALYPAASASDSDGSIAKVEFYRGTTLIASDASSPYSVTWSNVPAGTYDITARAYDNSGATVTSAPATITVTAFGSVAFQESGGTCVMEAEHFMQNNQRSDTTGWVAGTSDAGFAGDGYMYVPNNTAAKGSYTSSAELAFRVTVATVDTYYVAIRRKALTTADDHAAVCVNNVFKNNVSGTAATWKWVRGPSLGFLTAGTQTIQVRRYDDGFMADRIMIASKASLSLLPATGSTAVGPAESTSR